MSATIIVGRASSRCSSCGRNCFPEETHHWSTKRAGSRAGGCGEKFTAITTEYIGADIADITARMRPDLEFLPIDGTPPQEARS